MLADQLSHLSDGQSVERRRSAQHSVDDLASLLDWAAHLGWHWRSCATCRLRLPAVSAAATVSLESRPPAGPVLPVLPTAAALSSACTWPIAWPQHPVACGHAVGPHVGSSTEGPSPGVCASCCSATAKHRREWHLVVDVVLPHSSARPAATARRAPGASRGLIARHHKWGPP